MKEMLLPNWVGVVMALSLVVIALSMLAIAGTFLGMHKALRTLREIAGPALDDVRQLIGTIRVEVDAATATSRDIRGRVTRAADAAEARLVQVNDLLSGLQGSVQSTVTDIAGIIRMLVRSISFFDWRKKQVTPGRKTGRKKR